MTRVTALSEDAQRILGVAAVAGRTVEAGPAGRGRRSRRDRHRRPAPGGRCGADPHDRRTEPPGRLSVPACPPRRGRVRRPAPERAATAACRVRRRAGCATRPERCRGREPTRVTRASRDGGARTCRGAPGLGPRSPRRRRVACLRRSQPRVRASHRAVGCRAGGRSTGRCGRGGALPRRRPRGDDQRAQRRGPSTSRGPPSIDSTRETQLGAVGGRQRAPCSSGLDLGGHGRGPRSTRGDSRSILAPGGPVADAGQDPRRDRRRAHAARRPPAGRSRLPRPRSTSPARPAHACQKRTRSTPSARVRPCWATATEGLRDPCGTHSS